MTQKEHIFSLTKKDFDFQTFKSGGKGGQHQNKTDSGVRIIHKETGLAAESRSEKSQHQNKRIAFRRLINRPEFQLWIKRRAWEVTGGKSIEQRVDKAINDKNLVVEGKDEQGQWIKL